MGKADVCLDFSMESGVEWIALPRFHTNGTVRFEDVLTIGEATFGGPSICLSSFLDLWKEVL